MRFLLSLVVAVQQAPLPSPDTAHVVIVATTDVHGRVLGWDYVRDRAARGGLSRAAAILTTLRAQYPGEVVLVDAGDLLEGNPFAKYFARVERRRPDPVVDALNALQYDVATPGNHDFDFGLDLLASADSDATYRYVSANVVTTVGGRGGPRDSLLFPATVVIQRGPVRVGITGFTTPGVNVWDRRQLRGRVRVRPIAAAAPAALAALERAGVDLKLVLIHSGMGEPSSYDTTGVGPENDAAALARVTPRPDVVVVGHTHREMRDSVIGGVHFVQPRNWALSLSVVHVWLARDGAVREGGRWRVAQVRGDLIPLGDVGEVPQFARRFADAHERVRAWADEALGTGGPGFDARYGRAEDTPLLDFINAVQRRRSGAQLAATADFDPGSGLPDGTIHRRDVAGVYPYENTLVALRISGRQLRDFLEHSAEYYRTLAPGRRVVNDAVQGYNFDVVSGASYRIDLTRPPGQRIASLTVNGRSVSAADSFTLATNSYRAAGGGGYAMLLGAPIVYDRGEDIGELLAEEIRRVDTVTAAAYYTPSWAILPPGDSAARAAFAPPPPPVPQTDSTLLRVLAITDFHGALEPRVWGWSQGQPVGGAAVIKTWLDNLAKDCGCTSVRLDGGDELQGTPLSNFTFGRPVIAAFNALAIDAATIGDRDFDWGVDTLVARAREARYPFVSANISDSAGRVPDWVTPWTAVTRGGAKVAVIGLTTRSTPETTRPGNVDGLMFGDLTGAVRRVLPAARAAADFVIVLAHEGETCDSAGCRGKILALAAGLDSASVDLIVAGHTHERVDTVVHGVPIVQAGSSGRVIAVVDFVRAAGGGRVVRARLETPWADSVTPDRDISTALFRAQHVVDTIMARTVARLRTALGRTGDEYPLGRLVADAYRNIGKADVALINNGGIRADLPAGPVSYGALFHAQPLQNRLVRVTLTGGELREALEHALAGGRPQVHVSGLQVWYNPTQAQGRRIRRIRMLNGRSLDPKRRYTLAVPDFLAAGGDGFAMLSAAPRVDAGVADIDAVIAYLGVLPQPVSAPADARFHGEGRETR
ncbi:MAG TPA: 5'-nucleotidase C-terminal domain-containing protein [Gemmatimonadales bacterium]|nr:5'-nucleotidase C-terminal domain-containing protein [Gemmatimonadales bacterium]